ncbi:MAG: beta-eliminating lyase-related protein [Acidimicrobiia bacterium]|nr:beta-eliminating lyase-related protein [Acidimicrobiia bacterium]
MTRPRIDLHSDTATRPTDAMRKAIADAEVGDEQMGEDPTTHALEQRVADLLGKPAALFLPSGSMANKVSIAAQTNAGDVVICDRQAHVCRWESGGPSIIGGISFEPLDAPGGRYTPDQLRQAYVAGTKYQPPTTMAWLEQTHNHGGGAVWALADYEAVTATATSLGLAMHVDGARLPNAVVATEVPFHRWAATVDSIWFDFSKGLGAPMGAVLAGSGDFIEAANRYKYVLGGALRQSGMVAAACLYALDHHVDRLADDHANATRLAEGLTDLGCALNKPVESNMVYFDPAPAGLGTPAFVSVMTTSGIRFTPSPSGDIRAVTHLDVSADDIEDVLRTAEAALRQG